MENSRKRQPPRRPNRIQDIRVPSIGRRIEKSSTRTFNKLGTVAKETASVVSRSNIKTIEIKLTLPAWPKSLSRTEVEKRLRRLSRRTWLISGAAIAAVIILAIVLSILTGSTPPPPKLTAKSSSIKSTRPQLVRGTPSFPTVLPAGKTVNQLGGWVRVSPPKRAPVYAYIDHINKVQINVSEQPLPGNFKANPASSVAQLAQKFNAGDKFEAAGTTVYVATADDGSQSLIVNLKNLLVLISARDVVSNNQWAAYITALR